MSARSQGQVGLAERSPAVDEPGLAAGGIPLILGGIRIVITDQQAEDLRRQLGEPGVERVPQPSGEMLTPDEAAPLMRHSAKSVRKLCALPKDHPRYLRHLRKGREILIRRSHVDDWIAGQIGGGG